MRSALIFALILTAEAALADDAPRAPVKGNGAIKTSDSTNIDFGETLIDGKMQAPAGFFLQGRQAQSMTQMVKLRESWRSELRNSKAAVKQLVK